MHPVAALRDSLAGCGRRSEAISVKRTLLIAASLFSVLSAPTGLAFADDKPGPTAASVTPIVAQAGGQTRTLSPALRAWAPPGAAPTRSYEDLGHALLNADLDWVATEARRAVANGDTAATWHYAIFVDALSAGDLPAARAALQASPGGMNGVVADLMEPFLLSAEGRVDPAAERVEHGADNLPAPLPDVARALVYEGAGRLQDAARVYAEMERGLDLTPPGDDEPANVEELQRSLGAARTTHALYRAALVQHRLGNRDEARRLYRLVETFAPRSADVQRNLGLLDRGAPPVEPALNPKSAAGRWMFFLSEFVTQSETLAHVLSEQDPTPGLPSSGGALLLQLGLALAPDADDWRLYAATELSGAGGEDAALRVLGGMTPNSVFSAEADLARASIAIKRDDDAAAIAAAQRAEATAANRWAIITSAADVYRITGRSRESIAAFDRALALVQTPKERADILGWRAFAHRYAGEIQAATADVRAAYALDQGPDTKLLYISILMDDPQAWRDGVQTARAFFAEQPDSVTRLNALGYALIQRPEGLEEGYRLLWRGFNYGQRDYAVIDSLGWAYYLYGSYDEARALIERARDLSAQDPNPEVLDHLGDIYWRLNRQADARTQWRLALGERPDAIRRANLETKIARGLTTRAPTRRTPPDVNLPDRPAERGDT
jgi:tetratricopeptide (TPR) repeat protein